VTDLLYVCIFFISRELTEVEFLHCRIGIVCEDTSHALYQFGNSVHLSLVLRSFDSFTQCIVLVYVSPQSRVYIRECNEA